MSHLPRFPKLADLADQTDPQVQRRLLLEALDCVVSICADKTRMTNGGDEYSDPDSNGINKAIETAARIVGAIGVEPAVLLQFKSDTERLVTKARAILQERERPVLPAKGEEAPARKGKPAKG